MSWCARYPHRDQMLVRGFTAGELTSCASPTFSVCGRSSASSAPSGIRAACAGRRRSIPSVIAVDCCELGRRVHDVGAQHVLVSGFDRAPLVQEVVLK